MRKVISLLVVLLCIVLAGCATFRGMAEDAENFWRGVKKTISD